MVLWFYSPSDGAEAWRAALAEAAPATDVSFDVEPAAPELIRAALVYKPPAGSLARFPNLAAVFSLAAGVELLLSDPTLPDVPVCRMIDPALTTTVADYVHYAVLRVHRHFDVFERSTAWSRELPRLASEIGVAVLGLGEIGTAVARRLAAHGYRVAGWSRTSKALDGVVTSHGAAGLTSALRDADVVVGLLPSTPSTADLFDDAFFNRIKAGAHFINVGRGDQLVDAALLRALDGGRLAGATLDVFREEPLPVSHAFWHHPRILVTPHIAGSTMPATGARSVAENLRRLRAGEPLLAVVDRDRGY